VRALGTAAGAAWVLLAGCGSGQPFAAAVSSFEPGEGAGFGQEGMPDVVLGPPSGVASGQGSTDVLSLGRDGVIVLELGVAAVDGPGPDLIIFENPFIIAATGAVFGEPGEVAVSADAADFKVFPCEAAEPAPNGCAGYGVVLAGPDTDLDPTDPDTAGGDAFDLAEIGMETARYVRISDRSAALGGSSVAPTAGFDLDAVAVVER
jgi:hypothetical protein